MGKEIFAALLLLALLARGLYNTWYLENMIGEIKTCADISREYAMAGDFDRAVQALRTASGRWESSVNYTCIFLRQTEIECATNTFYELLGGLYSAESGAVRGAYEKLESHLNTLVDMQRVSLGSIF